MNRLIISTIPEDFDHLHDVPIGPCCFMNAENLHPDWESFNFEPNPFKSSEILKKNADLASEYANSLLPILAEYLNKKNNVHYSSKFWRILIMPWLMTFTHVLWERYTRYKQIKKKYYKRNLKVKILKKQNVYSFNDTLDFMYNGALSLDYNEWIFSRFIEGDCPHNWEIVYIEKKITKKPYPQQKKSWKRRLWDFSSARLRCKDIYGISPFSSFFWSLLLKIKVPIYSNDTKNEFDSIIPLDFKNIIDYLLKNTIPISFLNISKNKHNNKKPIPGKIRLIGPSLLYFDEQLKYNIALSVEAGEKIISTQHGGCYGTIKVHPHPAEIEFRQYGFLSWGWNKQEDYQGNIIPLPSPYLSKMVNKHNTKTENLIFVGTVAHLLSFIIYSLPQSLDQLSYRKSKITFLQQLSPQISKNVYYRPYFNDYGALKEESYIKYHFPNIKILNGTLNPEILKCKLLVLDHPGTTMNIAMAANIPTIFFWDKNFWSMCRQAESFFNALHKVGILFYDPEDAAKKVNDIWTDVDAWWNQPEIQKARQEWCWQYARTSKFWWWEWIKTLWSL